MAQLPPTKILRTANRMDRSEMMNDEAGMDDQPMDDQPSVQPDGPMEQVEMAGNNNIPAQFGQQPLVNSAAGMRDSMVTQHMVAQQREVAFAQARNNNQGNIQGMVAQFGGQGIIAENNANMMVDDAMQGVVQYEGQAMAQQHVMQDATQGMDTGYQPTFSSQGMVANGQAACSSQGMAHQDHMMHAAGQMVADLGNNTYLVYPASDGNQAQRGHKRRYNPYDVSLQESMEEQRHRDQHQNMQTQLGLILHSLECRKEGSQCTYPLCQSMKTLLVHWETCMVENNCPVPMCDSFKAIISHWMKCRHLECAVCGPFCTRVAPPPPIPQPTPDTGSVEPSPDQLSRAYKALGIDVPPGIQASCGNPGFSSHDQGMHPIYHQPQDNQSRLEMRVERETRTKPDTLRIRIDRSMKQKVNVCFPIPRSATAVAYPPSGSNHAGPSNAAGTSHGAGPSHATGSGHGAGSGHGTGPSHATGSGHGAGPSHGAGPNHSAGTSHSANSAPVAGPSHAPDPVAGPSNAAPAAGMPPGHGLPGWQHDFDRRLRNYLIEKLVRVQLPLYNLSGLTEEHLQLTTLPITARVYLQALIGCLCREESMMFHTAGTKDEYYYKLAQKMCATQKFVKQTRIARRYALHGPSLIQQAAMMSGLPGSSFMPDLNAQMAMGPNAGSLSPQDAQRMHQLMMAGYYPGMQAMQEAYYSGRMYHPDMYAMDAYAHFYDNWQHRQAMANMWSGYMPGIGGYLPLGSDNMASWPPNMRRAAEKARAMAQQQLQQQQQRRGSSSYAMTQVEWEQAYLAQMQAAASNTMHGEARPRARARRTATYVPSSDEQDRDNATNAALAMVQLAEQTPAELGDVQVEVAEQVIDTSADTSAIEQFPDVLN